MKKDVLNIETVHQCNCCLGNKTLHPLVSVIDLSKTNLNQRTIKFDFYTILLLEGEAEDFLYGRKYYDYSNASIVFLTPGESIEIDKCKLVCTKGWLLAFHPDLLSRTSLGENIKNYSFFSYKPDEALHLSQREKTKVIECMYSIKEELQHPIDYHSKTLISRYIELLLDYCSRFYERQFITRSEANKVIIGQTDALLEEYIQSGKLESYILPSASYCADLLYLSPHYFCDVLKFETGKSIYEYFQEKRLEVSKRMLSKQGNTVSMVAEKLGYSSTQYFSHLFKKLAGISPSEYRLTQS
ncbi:AraC family transcriptional regulator [Bacteroides sp.]|uniref:helix-turn-helix domain-containing protein n=1 Tax=Bacteroides sp. TaxID=29523 RepID=UPI00260E6945|nr:AraC family transcriptional regulator [Bacteroides sp.]MDD3037805.1 helix-turn-helix transcriptional regulator [Bacteroides sp.]